MIRWAFLLMLIAGSAAAEGSCHNPVYVRTTLAGLIDEATGKYDHGTQNAETSEYTSGLIDLLVKESPDCLMQAYQGLDAAGRAYLRSRAEEQADVCAARGKEPLRVDEDRSWCAQSLPDEACFTDNGAAFDWCGAYPSLLKKIKDHDAQTH